MFFFNFLVPLAAKIEENASDSRGRDDYTDNHTTDDATHVGRLLLFFLVPFVAGRGIICGPINTNDSTAAKCANGGRKTYW